ARGRMQRLVTDEEIDRAVELPPTDTRAYFRGRCLRQYSDSVAAASWDSVIFDIPGRESLQRVPTLEPLRGTKAHVGELLDRCRPAAALAAALAGESCRRGAAPGGRVSPPRCPAATGSRRARPPRAPPTAAGPGRDAAVPAAGRRAARPTGPGPVDRRGRGA